MQKYNILFDQALIFWEVVGLERGPLSLVGIIDDLFEWEVGGQV
jgi:hypothetical protein